MAELPNGRPRQWQRVSRKNPCPICHKPDWCAVSVDGQLVRCQRVEQGAIKTGSDKNGEAFYLHRLGDGRCLAVEVPYQSTGTKANRADTDALHSVYDATLFRLVLNTAHRDALRKRGLSDPEIDRRLYRSLPIQGRAKLARDLAERFGVETLLTVPGFVLKDKDGRKYPTIAGSAGLLIPVRDLTGRIVALKVRRDEAGDGPRYSYLSSSKYGGPSAKNAVHVPLGIQAPAGRVRLTEGELKADVAYLLSGLPTISAPGVASWRTALDTAKALSASTIQLAFDMDASTKAAVARSLAACVEGFSVEGFSVEVERWSSEHKGIDDALAVGVAVEVLAGDTAHAFVSEALAMARASESSATPDPLDRLDAVLSEAGAEGLFRDGQLLDALAKLSEMDPAEYACCRARLSRAGIRLRDLDAALAPRRQSLRAARPPLTSAGEYKMSGGRIVHLRPTKDGPVEVPLCNFTVRIVEQVTVDDGAEKSMRLAVEGALHDGTPLLRVEVPAEKFGYMEWVIPSWGTRAVVNAGAATKDHLRCAMQSLSGDVPQRVIYGHLGWRKIGEQWAYLHAGGAIGAAGPVDGVEVSPPDALARYVLPDPPDGEARCRAVRASLSLLHFGPRHLAFPLLAAVYRATLGGADFAVHLMGQSGVFKSELSALMQQHYGAELDARHLPASWASTANSLESIAFAAKDAFLTVDDFAPSGNSADVARLHREAERLLRAQGNAAGRQRMRADGSLRPAKPPRGLILSTGEDVPRGQSLRARLLILEASKNDFGPAPPAANHRLTECQRDAVEGLYAASMAAFIAWLAPQYEQIRGRLAAERSELRDCAVGEGQHARTPGIIADLALGLRYLLDFASTIGAVDTAQRAELWEQGLAALQEAGAAQADHLESAEPTGHFLRLLSAALASGRVHLAAPDGGFPETPSAWGWRREDSRDGPGWHPQGRRVGWVEGDAVLLEPEASFAAAQEIAGAQGESLTVSASTLRRRLKERGLLSNWDAARQELTIRRTLEGRRRKVLCLHVSSLGMEPAQPAHECENAEESGRVAGRVAGRETDNPPTNPPTNSPANAEENGLLGGLGGSKMGRDATTQKNDSAAYLAPGETSESTRTPFDTCGDEDAQPFQPPPAVERKERRRNGDRTSDLFANREDRDNG
ncbi:MAG TPA: DUF3854 domain-containing protein [Gemmataceae bacterium]|jgi:hypothetical protein